MAHFLGEIRRIPGASGSADWLICDGRILPIADHQPLFSLLGWRFGGDRRTTFGVPALQSVVASLHYSISTNGLYPTREDAMLDAPDIGEIRLFAGKHPPAGWLPCDGRVLPIGEPFLALFDVIGKTWGGDAEHFALPDLRGAQDAAAPEALDELTYIIALARPRPEIS